MILNQEALRLEVKTIISTGFQKNELALKNLPQRENNRILETPVDIKPAKEQLEKVIDAMNQMIEPAHTSSKFLLHEKLNDYYVQIVDEVTQEVIKEIPNKKFLDMYAEMIDFMGIFVDKKI
jgi:flagellar protein FlaG